MIKVHFLEGDSRGCLGGDECGWLQKGSMRTDDDNVTFLPLLKSILSRRMPCVLYGSVYLKLALCKIATYTALEPPSVIGPISPY